MENPFEELHKEIGALKEKLDTIIDLMQENKSEKEPDLLEDLIPKNEIRGKLASSSTLWKYEKEGKIQVYGIGGKRFYKRSELMKALVKLKK